MNPFGLRCRILLSLLLCYGGSLLGQDQPPLPSGSEVKPPPVDLVYKSLDLKYSATGESESSQSASGSTTSLQSTVVDLKAAGADIKETASEIKISLQGEILFEFDK